MKLALLSAAVVATAIPAAPALAHCRTVHHSVHHAAWHAPVRHRAVRYAGCDCVRRVAHRVARHPAVYQMAYARPRVVEVTYERPMPLYRPYRPLYRPYRPLYRPYRIGYAVPFYRPRPIFYGARFASPRFHRWEREGFYHRPHRWGGWR
jgi:hypothetical protein